MSLKILKKNKVLQYATFDGEIIALAPEIPAYFSLPGTFRVVWEAIDGESDMESVKERVGLKPEEFDSLVAKLLDAEILKEETSDA